MIFDFLTKVFGSKNERELKKLLPVVDKINALEPDMQALSDEQLRARKGLFRQRYFIRAKSPKLKPAGAKHWWPPGRRISMRCQDTACT